MKKKRESLQKNYMLNQIKDKTIFFCFKNATKVYILFICCTLNLTFFSESFIFSVKNDSKKVQLSYKYRFILLLGVFSNSFG